MISVFATALLENRSPNIYGDGEQTRDFTYVANVVDGVLRACDAPKASGEIINVATGGRISLNTLFRSMRDIIGGTVEPTYLPARQGDVRDSQADIAKAKALLGYEPIVSFEDGLEHTIDWYYAQHDSLSASAQLSANSRFFSAQLSRIMTTSTIGSESQLNAGTLCTPRRRTDS